MPSSLRLEEFSDRELLRLLQDYKDEHGWSSSEDLGQAIHPGNPHPTISVGIRFSYLLRMGLLEKHPEYPRERRWRLTPKGEAYAGAKFREAQRKTIEGLDETAILELTTALTRRYRSTDEGSSRLIRREWQYGTSKLRDPRFNGR